MYLVHVFLLNTYCTGVFSVRVALLAEKADIQYDPETMDRDTLVTEIKSLGFGAQLIGDAQGPDEGEVDLLVRNKKLFSHTVWSKFYDSLLGVAIAQVYYLMAGCCTSLQLYCHKSAILCSQ